jgi:hypothetical protein
LYGEFLSAGLIFRQPPFVDPDPIPFDRLGIDLTGQPMRCCRRQGFQRCPQVSATISRRLRSRTAATTWVASVR